MTVYILGGGPAGLALAAGLTEETSTDFVLFERDSSLGGLAKTVEWEDYGKHDLGPHKIFTLDQELLAKVKALVPQDMWLTRPKTSSIFMKGHYLPYPPSPFSLLSVYGLPKFSKMTLGYFLAKVMQLAKRGEEAKSFEDDLTKRLGKPLYEAMFKPLAKKLWADPKILDIKLSKGRVQTPSLLEVAANVLGVRKNSSFEALQFIYPKGGLQLLWSAIYQKTKDRGRFLTETSVKEIKINNNKIEQIVVESEQKLTTFTLKEGDYVFSTLPLGILARLLQGEVSPDLVETVDSTVILNDLVLVFLKIEEPELIKDSWIFIPDPQIPFHRISEQKAFDPSMTPNGSIVCCEIMSTKEKNAISYDDSHLKDITVEGLANMGISNFKLQDYRVIRLPKSYPVYTVGFEPKLKRILAELDSFDNFKTVGRQGAFNYIGTLDAMDIGFGAARWYAQLKNNSQALPWQKERERTSFYPVLD
ncbi:MAG: hypothetical protein D6780_04580 [Candidatus Dadabacteria bacterium]|nr:MAG: hypothetical protein D6780_04580 [Candidatus Dadabacteria bacterium]